MSDTPKLTREQAAIIGAYTGVLCGPFSDLHQLIEELMGRPVWTNEMGSKALAAEVRERARPQFVALLPEGT